MMLIKLRLLNFVKCLYKAKEFFPFNFENLMG